MSEKQTFTRRSVAAVVKAAERADVAWTTMMVVNTVFVWSAGVLSLLGGAPAANDTSTPPARVATAEMPRAEADARNRRQKTIKLLMQENDQ